MTEKFNISAAQAFKIGFFGAFGAMLASALVWLIGVYIPQTLQAAQDQAASQASYTPPAPIGVCWGVLNAAGIQAREMASTGWFPLTPTPTPVPGRADWAVCDIQGPTRQLARVLIRFTCADRTSAGCTEILRINIGDRTAYHIPGPAQ